MKRLLAGMMLSVALAGCNGGSDGKSVSSDTLLPGDPNCPNGGAALESDSGVSYVCSAPLYTGSAGVAVNGGVISLDTDYLDSRYLPASADAGGPRVSAVQFDADPTTLHLILTAAVASGTVTNGTVSVTTLDTSSATNPWNGQGIVSATVGTIGADPAITIVIGSAISSGTLVRVRADGTGTNPIMGATYIPLAGKTGGAPATADQGADFVATLVKP